jgi:hypothetical protein
MISSISININNKANIAIHFDGSKLVQSVYPLWLGQLSTHLLSHLHLLDE